LAGEQEEKKENGRHSLRPDPSSTKVGTASRSGKGKKKKKRRESVMINDGMEGRDGAFISPRNANALVHVRSPAKEKRVGMFT